MGVGVGVVHLTRGSRHNISSDGLTKTVTPTFIAFYKMSHILLA